MSEDGSRDDVTGATEVLENIFTGEVGQRSDNTRVVMFELLIKVCKLKKGLNILDLPRLRLVLCRLCFL